MRNQRQLFKVGEKIVIAQFSGARKYDVYSSLGFARSLCNTAPDTAFLRCDLPLFCLTLESKNTFMQKVTLQWLLLKHFLPPILHGLGLIILITWGLSQLRIIIIASSKIRYFSAFFSKTIILQIQRFHFVRQITYLTDNCLYFFQMLQGIKFAGFLLIPQVIFIILYGVFVDYDAAAAGVPFNMSTDNGFESLYPSKNITI